MPSLSRAAALAPTGGLSAGAPSLSVEEPLSPQHLHTHALPHGTMHGDRAVVLAGTYSIDPAGGARTPQGAALYHGVNRDTRELISVKVVDKTALDRRGMVLVEREVEVLREMHELCDFLQTARRVYVVTKRHSGVLLSDIVGRVSERAAKAVFAAVARAVLECHVRGVCHRNLRLSNCCFNPATGAVGFLDYASAATLVDGSKFAERLVGVDAAAAPELSCGGHYAGEPVDIYSLGVILRCLLTGAASPKDAAYTANTAALGDAGRRLLAHMLSRRPERRPTMYELLASQYLADVAGASPGDIPELLELDSVDLCSEHDHDHAPSQASSLGSVLSTAHSHES